MMTADETRMIDESKIGVLQRILLDAIKNGFHACDESVPAYEEPKGGCRCWVLSAKIALDYDDNG